MSGTGLVITALGVGGFGALLWSRQMNRWEKQINDEMTVRYAPLASAKQLAAASAKPANASSSDSSPLPSVSLTIRPAPRTFDAVFAAYGQGIPIPFLRALALHESNMDPRLATGSALGLLQVVDVVRADYNVRNRSNYTRQDLLDPSVNVTIAATTLQTMIRSYADNHKKSANLLRDWRNPQFVALVAFGWVAGYSERAGLGRVATFLEQRGIDVTIASVHDAAQAAGATEHLARKDKFEWAKRVARQYFREVKEDENPSVATTEIEMPPDFAGHGPPVGHGPPEIEMPPEFVGHEPPEIEMPPEFVGHASPPPAAPAEPAHPATAMAPPPSGAPPMEHTNVIIAEHPTEHTNVIIADHPAPDVIASDHPVAAGPVAAPPPPPAVGGAAPMSGGALMVASQPSGGAGPVDPYAPPDGLIAWLLSGGRHA